MVNPKYNPKYNSKYHKLQLGKTYHIINKNDCKYSIKSGNASMDKHSLKDFYNDSLNDDYLVVVKAEKNIPVGVIEIIIDDKFTVEMVAVDITKQGLGIGTAMMIKAESIAKQLNFKEIYLEAVENKVEFYKNLGFEIYAEPHEENGWGWLFPMKKKIDGNV
jgi:ribosomal protein S18 acetylase RimI-like enzyme